MRRWDALILSAGSEVVERAEREGGLEEPWSRWNITTYRHPLSSGLPFVGRWLDMPVQALPGDLYTPNMHWNSSASSERMIVSPGHEERRNHAHADGPERPSAVALLLELTSGVGDGEATPFLPGPTVYTLTLTP